MQANTPANDSQARQVAVLFGHVASNIGDMAINRGQIALLKRAFPGAAIRVVFLNANSSEMLSAARASLADLSVNVEVFTSHSQKALRYVADPGRFIEDCGLQDVDTIVLSAGEHLFYYEHGENVGSFFWRTLPAYAAKVAGKRCLMMPSTLGPFETPEAGRLASSLFVLLDGFAAREPRTKALLQAGGIAGESLPVLLDPAFFIEAAPRAKPRETAVRGRHFAVAMRTETWGIRLPKSVKEDGAAVEMTKASTFTIELAKAALVAPEDVLTLLVQTEADRALAEVVSDALRGRDVRIVRPGSIEEYVSLLADADVLVASRFHAVILASVVGTPAYGVYFEEHGHKMPGLFELLGATERCISLSAFQPEVVAANLAERVRRDQAPWPDPSRLDALREATVQWLKATPTAELDVASLLAASRAYGGFAADVALAGMQAAYNKKAASEKAAADERQAAHDELVASLGAKLKKLEAEGEVFRSSIQSLQDRLATMERERDERLVRVAELEGQLGRVEARAVELEKAASMLGQQHLLHVEELEGKLGHAEARVAELGGKLGRSETRVAELEEAAAMLGRQHSADLQEMRAKAAQVEKDLAARNAAVANMEAMLRREKQARGELEREHARELLGQQEQMASRLWAERDHWTSLLSYRAGHVLVEGLRRPRSWPLLPWRLYSEWRAYRADRLAREIDGMARLAMDDGVAPTLVAPSLGEDDPPRHEPMVVADGESVEATIAGVEAELGPGQARAVARELLRRGKLAGEKGDAARDLELAKEAMARDGSLGTLRGVFWAAQRCGAHQLACDAIVAIDARAGNEADEAMANALAQLKKTPPYQLSSLRLIEERKPSHRFVPEEGRICYVLHNSLPYSSGGYATRSHGIAGGLAANGYEPVCITRPGFPLDVTEAVAADLALDETIEGIRYARIPAPLAKGIGVPDYVSRSADALTEMFAKLRPECVIAASNYRVGLMALIAARRLGIPFAYEVRGWWELTRMSRDPGFVQTPSFVIQSRLENEVALHADHVFTLTEPMRESLLAGGIPPERITLLPNSCDPDRFAPMPRDGALAARLFIPDAVPVIGYIGTFVDYEGLDDLASACGLLARRGIEFRLLLVGNENTSGNDRGPITAHILDVAEREGFLQWLIMPGRVPHEEVESYYSLIDVAPFPRKPWPVCEMVSPMKPLEALAMEKAVLASDVRALAGMIRDGDTGILFRKGDVASMADALERMLGDAGLRARLGRRGREWVVSERTWSRVGKAASAVLGTMGRRATEAAS